MSFYEILKAAKIGTAPDVYTKLRAQIAPFAKGGGSTPTEKELEGVPPLSFTSNGSPLIACTVYGDMEQEGTPTPQNPIQPQECGERTGNIFSSAWEQGTINVSNGANIDSNTDVRTTDYIAVEYNKIYSFSRDISTDVMKTRFYASNKSYVGGGNNTTIELIAGASSGNPMAANDTFCCFKIKDSNISYMRIADASNSIATKYMMVEGQYTSDTMPSYVPYGYKIPILSANTTTNVYLGEVQSTRRIKQLVLTGEESWTRSGSTAVLYTKINDGLMLNNAKLSYCSHYPSQNAVSAASNVDTGYSTIITSGYFAIKDTGYSTADEFKTYLAAQYAAGTPVCVWYVLASETITTLNEPLRKIGDYSDSVSASNIPTVDGSNTIDIDTTLSPSKLYIKYYE